MSPEWTIPYLPNPGQLPFHLDRYLVRYRLLRGGTGSGKTLAGVFEILSWLLENPGAIGYIFEPTYRMVRRILLVKTFETLLGTPWEQNPIIERYWRTESRVDLIKGSRLWFGSLEDPEYAEGPNIDVIQIDEARLVPKFDAAMKVCQRRLRGSVPGKYPTGLIVTTTPDAPGSALFNFFENPKTRQPNSKSYPVSLDDNKDNLSEEYIADIKRSHTGGLADRFVFGRFAAVGDISFPFDYSFHVLQTIPHSELDIRYGVDFGWTNPSAIIVIGLDYDGRVYVLDEFYERHCGKERLLAELEVFFKTYGPGPVFCDKSEPESIEYFNLHGGDVGIYAVGYTHKRDPGIRELGSRFIKAGDGRPRIFLSYKVVNLISELQEYNERKKERDHAVDALRYSLPLTELGDLDAFRFGRV